MEFLDVNLTKDSSLLLHASRGHFYRQTLQKQSEKQDNSSLYMSSIFLNIKVRLQYQTKILAWVYAQKPRL